MSEPTVPLDVVEEVGRRVAAGELTHAEAAAVLALVASADDDDGPVFGAVRILHDDDGAD